jgi:SMC interacting uncharacterized protein involved in chromosome segregation
MESLGEIAKDILTWSTKLGILGFIIKLAYDQFRRIGKERDRLLEKNLDLRFAAFKVHLDTSVGGVKTDIESLETKITSIEARVNEAKPSIEYTAKAIEGEVHRYERIINGLKAVLKKSDVKFELYKGQLEDMEDRLHKIFKTIVSLNNKLADGKEIKRIEEEDLKRKNNSN